MKTQEEIEQLANEYSNIGKEAGLTHKEYTLENIAYKKGYARCQEDMVKELYEFGKLVLDTFHSEGKTHSGKDRLARIKFDAWFKQLNKQD